MDYIRNSKGKTTEANIVNRRTVLLRMALSLKLSELRKDALSICGSW